MTISFVRRFAPVAIALAALPACNLMCPSRADQFFETTVRAECHFAFACCTAGEGDILRDVASGLPNMSQYRDEAHCVEERLEEGSLGNELARGIAQAEAAGRFSFDYGVAQGCAEGRINALNNCDADFILGDKAPLETAEVCETVPGDGLVADGGDCFFDFECQIKGSRCLPPSALEDIAPCAGDDDCASDEFCDNNVCVIDLGAVIIHDEKICIAPRPQGDDCSIDPERPLLNFCEADLICITETNGDQTCDLPLLEGDDCVVSSDCERGLFCDGQPGECTRLKGEGDECFSSQECEIQLFCDTGRNTPTCEAPLPVEVQICNGIQGGDDPKYTVE